LLSTQLGTGTPPSSHSSPRPAIADGPRRGSRTPLEAVELDSQPALAGDQFVPDTPRVSSEPERLRLSAVQVVLMRELLVRAEPDVALTAERIAEGKPQPEAEVDALVSELSASMLSAPGFDGEELTEHRRQIDDIAGIVQQMSETFYR
jgi:hypothetical protein